MLTRIWAAAVLAALLLFSAGLNVSAQTTVTNPSQRGAIQNSNNTAGANTAVVVTLAATANQRNRIYGLSAYCSAGSATITIAEGVTTKFTLPTGAVGTAVVGISFTPAPMTSALGAAMTITLSTCGGGNTGVLNVQADTYSP